MPESRNASFPRALRVAEEVQKILGEIFLTKLDIPGAGMVTVTHVDLSNDLRMAKVHLSVLHPASSSEAVIQWVRQRGTQIRYLLAGEFKAKYMPELRFYLDDSLERSARIESIIEDLHRQDSPEQP